jgi:hypothetical protein
MVVISPKWTHVTDIINADNPGIMVENVIPLSITIQNLAFTIGFPASALFVSLDSGAVFPY